MLKEIARQSVSVGGVSLRLPLFALLYLENKGLFFEDLLTENVEKTTLFEFLKAAIIGGVLKKSVVDDFSFEVFESEKADEITKSLMCVLGLNGTHEKLMQVLTLALPVPVIGEEASGENPNFGKLKSLFCDIMKASESDFWLSTLREVSERWDTYAEVKGYKEPVTVVSQHYNRR